MCDDGRVQELPLTGRTVAVTAERKAEEIAAAFARRGARVLRAPAIRTVPLESDGELAEATQAIARQLAKSAPLALRGMIDCVNIGADCGMEEALEYESAQFGLVFSTEDMREGTQAFLQKRTPAFTGR